MASSSTSERRRHKQKLNIFSELMNGRIHDALLEIDRREQQLDAKLKQVEATFRRLENKQTTMRQKDDQRLAYRESLLTRWEAKCTTRARELAIIDNTYDERMAERKQVPAGRHGSACKRTLCRTQTPSRRNSLFGLGRKLR